MLSGLHNCVPIPVGCWDRLTRQYGENLPAFASSSVRRRRGDSRSKPNRISTRVISQVATRSSAPIDESHEAILVFARIRAPIALVSRR